MSYERDNALEEAARIADKWCAENRAAAAKARSQEGKLSRLGIDHPGMADMLEGAATECNAIAQAIRELKGSERAPSRLRKEPSIEERPY